MSSLSWGYHANECIQMNGTFEWMVASECMEGKIFTWMNETEQIKVTVYPYHRKLQQKSTKMDKHYTAIADFRLSQFKCVLQFKKLLS